MVYTFIHIDMERLDEEIKRAGRVQIEEKEESDIVTVELHVSCSNLPNCDVLSLTDAMILAFRFDHKHGYIELGRTEIVKDDLNPNFIKGFQIEYKFEERQIIKFDIYDVDDFNEDAPLAEQEFIGQAKFELHEIVGSVNAKAFKQIENPDK